MMYGDRALQVLHNYISDDFQLLGAIRQRYKEVTVPGQKVTVKGD
jgi:hypothetical protein